MQSGQVHIGENRCRRSEQCQWADWIIPLFIPLLSTPHISFSVDTAYLCHLHSTLSQPFGCCPVQRYSHCNTVLAFFGITKFAMGSSQSKKSYDLYKTRYDDGEDEEKRRGKKSEDTDVQATPIVLLRKDAAVKETATLDLGDDRKTIKTYSMKAATTDGLVDQ